jgi:ankyrin repeat protein
VNTPRTDGWTPLMVAALTGNARVVSTLLKAGASARAVLRSGKTALSLAKSRGHADIVALLEKA